MDETSQGSRGGNVRAPWFRWFAVGIGQSFGLLAPLRVAFLFLLGLTSIKFLGLALFRGRLYDPPSRLSQGGGGKTTFGVTLSGFMHF